MIMSVWFWLLMFILFLGSFGTLAPDNFPNRRYFLFGSNLIIFLLFVIIGFKVFGSPIQ